MRGHAVKIVYLFVLAFILAPFSAGAQTSEPLTLADCYALALKKSEVIAIDAEVIKEAEAHFLQSLGQVLPNLSFSSTVGRQDVGGNASQRNFVFKQNLFSGFKEFAGMSGSKLEKQQYINQKARAEELLLTDVADAFYLLVAEEKDYQVLKAVRLALLERLKSLNQRLQLGRSRPSEVVNTEAQLYQVEAEIETVKTQEVVARQLLEFLTGQPIDKISDQNNSFPVLSEPESSYLLKVDTRHDVLAALDASGVSKKKEVIAKSDLFPSVTLENNYYTHRTEPLAGSWDAFVTIDVPLFDATTFGNIKQAKALAVESALNAQRVRRLAVLDIRESYVRLSKAIDRTKAVRRVVRAAQMSYMLQKKDYEMSLVNNLDVLASIQTLQQSWRDYIQAYYNAKRLYWELRVAVGETIPGR